MSFNLLEEAWIPVRTSDGYRKLIAPWQITATIRGAPVVAVDSPRPDFSGALIQFLIGLVQSSELVPAMELDWEDGLEPPPPPNTLQDAFSVHKDAFNLDGDFPRFLQDLTMENGSEVPINALLIDPTGNEHFIKPRNGDGFCFGCAATALFCLHTNAPEGGRGHLTGLRGGGPLTSLVLPPTENLWHTLWLNVVSREDLVGAAGYEYPEAPQDIFPWLAATRSADPKTGGPTYPQDAHPLQMYWSMPRRIRLDCTDLGSGSCLVCGQSSDRLIQRCFTRPHGVNYAGNWIHPLTAYWVNKDGEHSARKARAGTINYRNWVGLVVKSTGENGGAKGQQLPARVVHRFTEKRWRAFENKAGARLWGFGYDMDHMRARCWFDGKMPIPAVLDERITDEYATRSERMVRAAITIGGNLGYCLKEAWFRFTANVRGDTGFVTTAFWSRSEPMFFTHLHALISELARTYPDLTDETLRNWHRDLCRLARQLFDEYVTSGPIEDQDPARIARARNKLNAWNQGKNVKEKILHLPKEIEKTDDSTP